MAWQSSKASISEINKELITVNEKLEATLTYHENDVRSRNSVMFQ